MSNLKGFVNIIKPTGMTSSDVVCKVKKILHMKKVGHLGTLDPAASGVLPVAVGKATKFFDYFLSKEKKYTAVVRFGIQTDTLDSFGNITRIEDNVDISEDKIKKVIPEFLGEIEQYPPKFSALKVGGKKAYELAREGIEFELKPRKITIHSIALREKTEKNTFVFDVHCSAGTYIRTLFSDIAEKIGTIANVPVIIRTKSGAFNIDNAVTFEEFEQNISVIKIEDVFQDFEMVDIDENMAKKVLNGVPVSLDDLGIKKVIKMPFLIKFNGEVVGLYELKNNKTSAIAYVYDN
ncbi:MAG: tRNA pseudouridine(55) synthase TruB [Clostridia bacterium]|nr:tRNA pseudouridine(55) synthase TruB [Clostridia bacterium]